MAVATVSSPQGQLVVAGRFVHVVQHRVHASVTIPVGHIAYGVNICEMFLVPIVYNGRA